MKYIALIAIFTLLLLELSGSIPQSSVGGPMTIALVIFAAALAVGIRDAWLHKRGVLGWIVSIIVSFVGTFVAAEIGGFVFEMMQPLVGIEGSLAQTRHPLLYVSLVAMVLITMLGSWLALQLVNRLR
jgi:Na+/H+-dicarboxylate symporter